MASQTNIALVLNSPSSRSSIVAPHVSSSPAATAAKGKGKGKSPALPSTVAEEMLTIELSLGFYPHDGSSGEVATVVSPEEAGVATAGGGATTPTATAGGGATTPTATAPTTVPALYKKSMSRPKTETLLKTVERIRLNFEKKGQRKKGNKTTREDLLANLPTLSVLDDHGNPVDLSLPNDEAWALAKSLRVGTNPSQVIPIIYNTPTVLAVKPPTTIVMGVPCVSSGVTVVFHCNDDLLYEWRVRKSDRGFPTPSPEGEVAPKKGGKKSVMATPEEEGTDTYPADDFVVISTTAVFTPAESEELRGKLTTSGGIGSGTLLGKTVYCRVRPNVPGTFWTEVECPRVSASLAGHPQPRWQFTPTRLSGEEFRVVSYNILHDAFCTSKYAMSTLYPFCPPHLLDLNFRKGRILQELAAYNTDIFCLQECGKEIYNKYYRGVLAAQGYDTIFTTKTGNVTEGVATGYDNSKYSLLEHHWFPLSYKFFTGFNSVNNGKKVAETRSIKGGDGAEKSEDADLFLAISQCPEVMLLQEAIAGFPHLEEGLRKVTSVGSATVLRQRKEDNTDDAEKKDRLVIVSNCHLFWHPNGCHIRTLQCYLHMVGLELLRARLQLQHPASSTVIATVCCGDYNCGRKFREEFAPGAPGTPTGGYELISTSQVRPVNRAWQKGMKFWWGGEGEASAAAEAAAAEETEVVSSSDGDDDAEDAVKDKKKTKNNTSAGNPATTIGAYTKHGPPTTCFQGDLRLPSSPKPGVAPSATFDDLGAMTPSGTAYYMDTHLEDPDIQWTNFSLQFKAVIDHIFISREVLSCTRTIPLPTEAEVTASTCIPSDVFPSDHLALVADLRWK